ncbi:MAG: hypothetical protein ACYCZT_00040 [Thiobacillus sp.]
MLRTLLLATVLITTSGAALARDNEEYGRVIAVEPSFSFSFGTRHHDGYRVPYETGGQNYWAHTPQHPGHRLILPPHHPVAHHDYGYSNQGWNNHYQPRRHDEWREERRERREHRRHDREDH